MIKLIFFVILLKVQRGFGFQSSFIRDCLDAHNEVRALHGVPPLQWDTDIAVGAQKWANHLAAIDQMQHEISSPLGENLFYMYGGDPKEACKRAVKNWYQELKNYDFVTPHSDDSTSHFSQVVWRATRKMGIGTAQSKSGNFFLVARYDPKGNVDGTFSDNVPGPLPEDVPGRNSNQSPSAAFTPVAKQPGSMGTGNAGINPADAPLNDERQSLMRLVQPSILLPKRGKDFRVELRFPDMEFTENMNNPSSEDYIETKRKITEAILQTYEDDDDFLEAQVLSLRNGSVLATLGLLFSTVSAGHLNRLTGALGQERLGKFVVSPAYESAEALPAGYLKLTLPKQRPNDGVCPQPCSNPDHCFKQGCMVSCCAFRPVTPPAVFQGSPHYVPAPPPPPPPPVVSEPAPGPTTGQACPGACDDRCSPYCDESCCSAVTSISNQPQPQPQAAALPPSPPHPETVCPSSCSVACYPECIPGCCEEERTAPQCPTPCPALCAPTCSQACCEARKSAIHRYQQMAALQRQAHMRPKVNPFSTRPLNPGRVAGFNNRPPSHFRPMARPLFQRQPVLAKAQKPLFYRQAMQPQNNY